MKKNRILDDELMKKLKPLTKRPMIIFKKMNISMRKYFPGPKSRRNPDNIGIKTKLDAKKGNMKR